MTVMQGVERPSSLLFRLLFALGCLISYPAYSIEKKNLLDTQYPQVVFPYYQFFWERDLFGLLVTTRNNCYAVSEIIPATEHAVARAASQGGPGVREENAPLLRCGTWIGDSPSRPLRIPTKSSRLLILLTGRSLFFWRMCSRCFN